MGARRCNRIDDKGADSMIYSITERFYKTYEIEADSFEEAKQKAYSDDKDGDLIFDDVAFITDENGAERIY
jgi:hypothetical protein